MANRTQLPIRTNVLRQLNHAVAQLATRARPASNARRATSELRAAPISDNARNQMTVK